jgi:hypoxanthine phosphoribosyltransferase
LDVVVQSINKQRHNVTPRGRVPAAWRKDLKGVVISQRQIATRVRQLSHEIERDFAGQDLVVVAILNGTVMFLADLIRNMSMPLRLDFIGVSSYRLSDKAGELVFTKELRLDVRGRSVLLVDDILDTGQTLCQVSARLRQLEPRRLKTCVLLEKSVPRANEMKADYVGFSIPNLFVVGYGLDYAERYRNLPFIGVVKELRKAQ